MDFYQKYGNGEVCPHGKQKEISQMGKNLTLKCLPRIWNFAQMGEKFVAKMSTILSLKRTIFFALLSCGFAQMSNAENNLNFIKSFSWLDD